jgi:hypothetical protein
LYLLPLNSLQNFLSGSKEKRVGSEAERQRTSAALCISFAFSSPLPQTLFKERSRRKRATEEETLILGGQRKREEETERDGKWVTPITVGSLSLSYLSAVFLSFRN